jgi:hypothetical protein
MLSIKKFTEAIIQKSRLFSEDRIFANDLYRAYDALNNESISKQEFFDEISRLTNNKSKWLNEWAEARFNQLEPEIISGIEWRIPRQKTFWNIFCKVCDNKPIGKCCGDIAYCSTKCQEKDWQTHENDCKRKIKDAF